MILSNEEIKESQFYNVEDIMDIIEEQLKNIFEYDPDFYGDYDYTLTNEKMFAKNKEGKYKTNTIYIVVKFLPAQINYGQNIIPVTITAVAEQNKFDVCQRLLMEYAQAFNLRPSQYFNKEKKLYYNQSYDAPSVMSNFNEVYSGYRTLLTLTGEFLISSNATMEELYYYPNGPQDENPILIETLAYSESYDASLDTQPYTNKQNFTDSIVKFGSNSFNITIYLMNDELCNKILRIKYRLEHVDTPFYFGVKYNNQDKIVGETNAKPFIYKYKLVNASNSRNIGEMPVISLTFIN